ncbi:MAG: hypothetical protein J3K34DRAFT_29476 [Monoraphidium minutum]|nr:MAG: hypothetical protein J3K34DRAFT_29476 [Monoraphidium minutum]
MLAEAVHSLVDVANQMLLRIGLKKAEKGPTKAHPFGYSRDQFVWPLISAVGIFCCGAGISFVHGVQGLFTPHEVGPLFWNFVVLGVSFVLESHSLAVAVRTLQKRAVRQGMTLWTYVKTGSDPAATAVMMEDGAAVAGLVIAGACLGLVQATGSAVWDSAGSIAVSALLGIVAVTLIQRNRQWLIGKSMPADPEALIVDYLRRQPVVRAVKNVKSEELGVRNYRFQAELAFDGAELARRCLDRVGRTALYQGLEAAAARRDAAHMEALLMQFATVTVSAVGAEVDRMEQDIMRIVPGVRYVDLETDRGKPLRPPSPETLERQRAALADWHARERAARGAGAQPENSGGGAADPGAESDHLADLVHFPLGSISSFDSRDEDGGGGLGFGGGGDWVISGDGPSAAAAAAALRERLQQQGGAPRGGPAEGGAAAPAADPAAGAGADPVGAAAAAAGADREGGGGGGR